MEVHELKEVLDDKFKDLSTNLDKRFDSMGQYIGKLDEKVTKHDRDISRAKGIGVAIVGFLSYVGIKIHL